MNALKGRIDYMLAHLLRDMMFIYKHTQTFDDETLDQYIDEFLTDEILQPIFERYGNKIDSSKVCQEFELVTKLYKHLFPTNFLFLYFTDGTMLELHKYEIRNCQTIISMLQLGVERIIIEYDPIIARNYFTTPLLDHTSFIEKSDFLLFADYLGDEDAIVKISNLIETDLDFLRSKRKKFETCIAFESYELGKKTTNIFSEAEQILITFNYISDDHFSCPDMRSYSGKKGQFAKDNKQSEELGLRASNKNIREVQIPINWLHHCRRRVDFDIKVFREDYDIIHNILLPGMERDMIKDMLCIKCNSVNTSFEHDMDEYGKTDIYRRCRECNTNFCPKTRKEYIKTL